MPPTLPYIIQRQQIALELEAVEGTGETIEAADVLHPTFDNEWTPNFTMNERNNLQPSLSRITQVAGERSAVISFSTEVKGSGTAGTAPPNLSKPMQACGFDETIVAVTSVTYAPVSEAVPTSTIEVIEGRQDGSTKIHRLVGVRL